MLEFTLLIALFMVLVLDYISFVKRFHSDVVVEDYCNEESAFELRFLEAVKRIDSNACVWAYKKIAQYKQDGDKLSSNIGAQAMLEMLEDIHEYPELKRHLKLMGLNFKYNEIRPKNIVCC